MRRHAAGEVRGAKCGLWGVYRQLKVTWTCLEELCSGRAIAADPEFCRLQSEPEGFSHFHLYVCAAFLIKWRKEILDEEDFQVSPQCVGLILGKRGGNCLGWEPTMDMDM